MAIKIIMGDSRDMTLIPNESIHFIVCSPPYFNIKDYGHPQQIGFNQTYNAYIESLNEVWQECFRVLKYGCHLAINIGNVYTRTEEFGRHKTISIKTDIIKSLEKLGFDLRSEIIWHKISTTKSSGCGSSLVGSIYYPRNVIPTQEHEYILVFKKFTPINLKHKKAKDPRGEVKEESKIPKKQFWKYARAYWKIPGKKQNTTHPAQFPLEIPYRLIKMYSFKHEFILDPFLGSGTTLLASMKLGRHGIGYEINRDFKMAIKRRLGFEMNRFLAQYQIHFYDQKEKTNKTKIEFFDFLMKSNQSQEV